MEVIDCTSDITNQASLVQVVDAVTSPSYEIYETDECVIFASIFISI
jgi:uncharacterized UPF0146 family protein